MRFYFVFLSFLIIFSCKTQELELSQGTIDSELHQENIGSITFMNETIPYESYTENDFKSEVTLNQENDFSFRMFLGKSLTSYLHDLAPDLSVNQLCDKGNFQVNFFIENKLVFSENLHVNAGSCWYMNSASVYRVPLISKKEEDHWGRYLWMRFLYEGGGIDLEAGSHDFKVDIRPYIELDEIKVGEVIASGEVKLMIEKAEIKIEEAEIAVQEIRSKSGWEVSSEEYDEDLIRALNKDIATEKFKEISGIVVIKNGKLLIEEYFNGTTREEKHNTRSVGKSFMSAAMGLAIDKGYIKSENKGLGSFYDLQNYQNYTVEKENVTIKQLLTMSSGFEGDDSNMDSPGNEEYMYPTDNWVKFALDQPLRGSNDWRYFTAGSVVLGDIIHQSVPGGLEKFADEALFQPLGITSYQWQYTPQKVANTAGGIQMNALDFAKFGQLYQNKGKWNGKQVISEKWIEKSFEPHAVVNEATDDYYGYQFWKKTFTIDGKQYEVNYCTGTGGNKIYIFKDVPLVVVITTKAFRLPQAHSQVRKMMEEYILPAVL